MSARQPDLLVEIGTEELPPRALASLAVEFHDRLQAILGDELKLHDTGAGKSRYFYSPRRLSVIIEGLRPQQPDRQVEKYGPALNIAYDDAGQPTRAATGFARSCNTTVDQLQEKDGKLYFAITEPGKPAGELIPSAINDALARLPIPKRMRWGNGTHEFVRPVHWLVVLLGEQLIDCELLGIKSDRFTRGHRYHQPEPIELASAADYVSALQQGRVWLNDSEQQLNQVISEKVAILAEQVGGQALNSAPDSDLVAEVAALVEWPVPLRGEFDPQFLELPEEVLIATLEDQQRYFAIREHDTGKLLPYFITVANIESLDPEQVRKGNERVIVPRLSDAMFFWQTDRAQTLASRMPALDSMTFQKRLGSLGDKMKRVAELAATIATDIGGDADKARRAAALAKCDLVTQMVGEFPELQGVAGGYLATHDGEDAEVACAIGEQYRPRYAGDALPQTASGRALAIADKIDTLVGIFAIGQAPTGEKDPFALRRAALGVLRIIIEGELNLDLKATLATAAEQFADDIDAETALTPVFEFMMERLRRYYLDNGVSSDSFEAVLACQPTRPLEFHQRLLAVQDFRQLAAADSLAAANKRIGNLLKQADGVATTLDAAVLEDASEKHLAAQLEQLQREIEPLLATNQYAAALTALAGLRDSVDAFFDNVMVMCDDPELRSNRIALLASLSAQFRRIADISRLQ
ncbi:glycyl-tRNA synthetase beta chain [Methylohalomonas lacus]|uniref:Glycine--tRNA ligase beta subunit n=1 Tax=Methylohalomonas lacus TaxID=398773 RepID=A0AAE3HLH7_9GAMM|nr:glycine--tRNA ligase subunit beta [Methylohalomonas lacus]MCS3903423.1 glycyl-tRNA synthetase beta chain [Methylohalomonas lacus]